MSASAGRADPVRFEFLGSVRYALGGATAVFSPGDPVSGLLDYDPELAGRSGQYYANPTPITQMALQVGSYSFAGDLTDYQPHVLESFVLVTNDAGDPAYDQILFRAGATGPQVGGYSPASMQFSTGRLPSDAVPYQYTYGATVLDSLHAHLPFDALNFVTFGPVAANTRVEFQITSFTVTEPLSMPEPGSGALLCAGLLGALRLARQRA
jgi:hypothetical protein